MSALPEVITQRQVFQMIDVARSFHIKCFIWVAYTLGLCIGEAINLQVGDIDRERMMAHVQRGKGAKDRYIPLPKSTLAVLRALWLTHRNRTFVCPAEGRNHSDGSTAETSMSIFNAGQQTIRTLMAKPKNMGSDKVGFFGVLHTWGRDLNAYHPHVHFVVPGGGISPDGSKWLQTLRDHLFHPLPAKQLYKKFFVEAIRKAGLYDQLPPGLLKFDWVVNRKPVGDGKAVLKYLAPYVYRVAVCDNRILSVDDSGVTYKVKPSGKRLTVERHLSGEGFVRAFAQHILPPGFRKVRYYGFMSSNSKLQLTDARWLVWLWLGWTLWTSLLNIQPKQSAPKPMKCDGCGGEMELVGVTDAEGRWLWRRPTSRGPPELKTIAARPGESPS